MAPNETLIPVNADTSAFTRSMKDLAAQTRQFETAIRNAFKSAVIDGKRFDEVLKSLALSLSRIALQAALKPIEQGLAAIGGRLVGALGSLGGLLPFSRGGVVGAGVTPLADGGVVARPTYFPLGRGLGLAGEAGAEAILPLARASDGRLGVRAEGGSRPVSVTFNVTTPDAASFRRSEVQLTAMLARAVQRGRRGL